MCRTATNLGAVKAIGGNEPPLVDELVSAESRIPLCFDQDRRKQTIAVPSNYMHIRFYKPASHAIVSSEVRPEANTDTSRLRIQIPAVTGEAEKYHTSVPGLLGTHVTQWAEDPRR